MLGTEPPQQPASSWRYRHGRSLGLDRARVMAILNITPDSFSDGGQITSPDHAATLARAALAAGADAIDVGGESTRPGAQRVSADEQIRRVVPTIRAVRDAVGPAPLLTIDTTRAAVAHAALEAGADAVNDVSAGEDDPAMLPLVAERRCGVILMHRTAPPDASVYSHHQPPGPFLDIVREVASGLVARTSSALSAGIPAEAILLDPGLGFGKTVDQNLELITRTGELLRLGFPILSALSRKSFVAAASGLPPESGAQERAGGTLALTIAHHRAGARLFRVHDPVHTVRALRAWERVSSASIGGQF
jgi:dihydropteroate synthase